MDKKSLLIQREKEISKHVTKVVMNTDVDLNRRVQEISREQAKTAASSMGESELTDLIDEAVQWAREH
jgi:hypothetical protein